MSSRVAALGDQLAVLDGLLREKDPATHKRLRPGTSAAAIAKLALDDDASAAWFAWHDGERIGGESQLDPANNVSMLSVREVLSGHRFLRSARSSSGSGSSSSSASLEGRVIEMYDKTGVMLAGLGPRDQT